MYRHGVIRLQAADLTGIIGSATPPKPGSGRFREDTLRGLALYLLQSVIIGAVVVHNEYNHWTPNKVAAAIVGILRRDLDPVKLAVRREFILSNGHPITIRQVLQRGYPRLRCFTAWHYLSARRALRGIAVVIARSRFGKGRPCN
jgi:hypothetical protein